MDAAEIVANKWKRRQQEVFFWSGARKVCISNVFELQVQSFRDNKIPQYNNKEKTSIDVGGAERRLVQ